MGTSKTSRRDFLKTTTGVAAASALTAAAIPYAHAAGGDTIRVALIGAGGRGTGAADNALNVKSANMKLVAIADVFEDRLKSSHEFLSRTFKEKCDVPEERRFLGFDAYKKAMDCLGKGDIAIFATPPGFRWVHFQYAIEKGLNVFMEKPVTVDGPTSRRMFDLGVQSQAKNMKVGVGLMVRHCRARRELYDRLKSGAIGDLICMRAYRMHGPVGSAFSAPKPADMTDLLYQIRRFHSYIWASGGLFSDFYIHQIDETAWMKGAWPIRAHATGGRHYRGSSVDQNFDQYTVEYTYPDGTKMFMVGRTMTRCETRFASHAHGAWGTAIISKRGHHPGEVAIFKDQAMTKEKMIWEYPQPEANPYQLEWDDLVEAIQKDLPYNEVERGVKTSLVTSMGRMAAHTGQVVTYDDILNSDHEMAPGLDKLTYESDAPLMPGADGKYPVPEPGRKGMREY